MDIVTRLQGGRLGNRAFISLGTRDFYVDDCALSFLKMEEGNLFETLVDFYSTIPDRYVSSYCSRAGPRYVGAPGR